jgi:hypothetical protein
MRRTLLLLAALAGALLALAPAQGARADDLTLNVEFSYTGQIAVTNTAGAAVGSTSGAPTVIPAGYYTVVLSGPGGCTLTPYFVLRGPGVTVTDNMAQGEDQFNEYGVTFQPSSTYTWVNSANPTMVYTFQTSSQVVGTKPPQVTWNGPTNKGTQSNKDVVGSGRLPARGTLTGVVNPDGTVTIAFKGKHPATLRTGKYTFVLTDKSPSNGLTLARGAAKPTQLTAPGFVGRQTVTLNLSTGRWIFATTKAKASQSILVG